MEMIEIFLRILNGVTGCFLVVYFIVACTDWVKGQTVVYLYALLLGIGLIVADFYMLPKARHYSLLYHGIGRGLLEMLFSAFMFDSTVEGKVCGSLLLILGMGYTLSTYYLPGADRGKVPRPYFTHCQLMLGTCGVEWLAYYGEPANQHLPQFRSTEEPKRESVNPAWDLPPPASVEPHETI